MCILKMPANKKPDEKIRDRPEKNPPGLMDGLGNFNLERANCADGPFRSS
jgi:hypothetical protein